MTGKRLVEPYGEHEFVVQNPPAAPLSTAELDAVYRLPFVRAAHPDYDAAGGVPAIKEVKFSLASNRGCFGECAFCALTFHQGRVVQVRSRASLVAEAEEIRTTPTSRATSTMSAARRRTSAHPPAASRLTMALVGEKMFSARTM